MKDKTHKKINRESKTTRDTIQIRSNIAKRILKFDPSDIKSDFDNWPLMASESWDSAPSNLLQKSPSSVVIVGMGGSGIVGEIISDARNEAGSEVPIHVVKDYHLPRFIDDSAVVVGISCSGNTEETLAVLHEASERGLPVCTFGSGGALEEFSKKHKKNFFTRTTMQKVPRSSLPGLLYPVLKFFVENRLISIAKEEISESIRSLVMFQKALSDLSDPGSNQALTIATTLGKRKAGMTFPLIYSSRRTRAVGLRFRQSLNENAKIHGFEGSVPEICHNDIVGWDSGDSVGSTSFQTALLELADDPIEIQTRFKILKEILKSHGSDMPIEAPSIGKSWLSRILSMLYCLDYSSYYTAIIRGTDPIKTPSIDFLKNELRKRVDYLKTL